MSEKYNAIKDDLQRHPGTWLITGVTGFIGSNLLEALLKLDQRVVGLDNFSTGYQHNLDDVKSQVSNNQWQRFTMVKGDICNLEDCHRVLSDGVDYVLHQAALGSVPRSIKDPIATNKSNVSGFLNMLVTARDASVSGFVYAASSSTYGDHPKLPKTEEKIGKPLSPYAVTKYVDELYADVFAINYGFKAIGLRYFNVFGKRQDPNGAYAAVIPQWIEALLNKRPVYINGDGKTSRDFCFVENVVQANILSAVADKSARNEVYNIAVGDRTSLNELSASIRKTLLSKLPDIGEADVIYRDFRAGDVRHSQADISKATAKLGYLPLYDVNKGLEMAIDWYIENHGIDGDRG